MLSKFLIIPVVREKIRVKLTPVILLIGAPTTLTEVVMQTAPLLALKTFKTLSM